MADIASLFAALQASDKAAEESNPFSPMADVGGQVGQVLIQNAGNPNRIGSIGENVIAGLLSGLVTGGSKNLGDRYKAGQSDLAQQFLLNPTRGVLARPDGMAPSVFSNLNSARSLFQLNDQMQANEAAQKAKADLTNTVAKGVFENPYKAERGMKALSGFLGGQTQNALPAGVAGADPGASQSGAAPSVLQPSAPGQSLQPGAPAPRTLDSYLEQFEGNESAANEQMKFDRDLPQRNAETEDKLRQQFLNIPAVRDFGEISKQFAVLQQAAKDPTAVSDLDYTFGIMKILDPTSIVRETEQGQIIESQALPASMLGRLNKVINGEATLDITARQNLMNLAQRRYDVQKSTVDGIIQEYQGIATSRGANPGFVTVLPQAPVQQMRAPASSLGAAQAPSDPVAALAKQFPPTPEGRAAFKEAVKRLNAPTSGGSRSW